jgi:hypothetical protein
VLSIFALRIGGGSQPKNKMPAASMLNTTLQTLTEQKDWPKILGLFENARSGKTVLQMAIQLEQLARGCAEAKSWLDAVMCAHLAMWPSAHGAGIRFPEKPLQDYFMRVYPLTVALEEAMRNGAKQDGFWENLVGIAVAVAQSGRLADADPMLMWLQTSKNRRWAALLENAGEGAADPQIRLWLLRRAREGFQLFKQSREAERLRERILALEDAVERANRA